MGSRAIKKVVTTLGLLFSVLLGFGNGDCQVKPAPQARAAEIPNVSLCELVQDPTMYDQKLVRLNAIYAVSFEWVLLYDCSCGKKKSYIYPVIAGATDEASQVMGDAIAKHLKFGRNSGDRVGLVMTGIFLAPHPNPAIHEVGNTWPTFRIMSIEKINEIPETAPAPSDCPLPKR